MSTYHDDIIIIFCINYVLVVIYRLCYGYCDMQQVH